MGRRTAWGVVCAAALALVAACSGAPTTSTEPTAVAGITSSSTLTRGSSPPRASSPTASASSSVSPSPVSTNRPITLAFGGDVNFDKHGELVADHALDSLRAVLGDADVAVVNLETAITDRGTEQPKIYHFRTSPQALVTLQQAGIDAVSLANNHAVDYGPVGLADTLEAKAASPIPVIGIGRDAAAAFAPATFTVKGVRIAVIASTQVNDYTVNTYPATDSAPGVAGNFPSNSRLLAAVAQARASYDVVVVFLHWGTDYTTCPDAAQQRTERALESAGVDVVVGGHAHRVQGYGWHGRTFVQWGLGNFVWNVTRGVVDTYSGVQTVSIDPARARAQRAGDPATRASRPTVVTGSTWTPLVVGTDGIPRAPTASQAPGVDAQVAAARACSGLTATPPR